MLQIHHVVSIEHTAGQLCVLHACHQGIAAHMCATSVLPVPQTRSSSLTKQTRAAGGAVLDSCLSPVSKHNPNYACTTHSQFSSCMQQGPGLTRQDWLDNSS
jgi:hypothetical protein